jgi:Amt family ammonium transporter
MLQSGYMVFFMQAGFAMLCAGSVRAKNAKNIILLNILDACLGSLVLVRDRLCVCLRRPRPSLPPNEGGFTLHGQAFIGNRYFFGVNLDAESDYAFWFFQFTFAATAATIVSGAVAERCRCGPTCPTS